MSETKRNEEEKIRAKEKIKVLNEFVLTNEFWKYCDNCGSKLISFRCKMICPHCGFYRSCNEP